MEHTTRAATFDVTSLGEIMVRLSVPTGERLDDAESLTMEIGGAEGNLSIALARLGRSVAWLGRLPLNSLGEYVVRTLRADGVNVSGVRRTARERVGLYFIEYASTPRNINVIYDRADSAAAKMSPSDVDWDLLLDTRILHLTGITPALSSSCRDIVRECFARARSSGIRVSFDVNFRSKLWNASHAGATLRPFMEQADVLFCKSSDAAALFGCGGSATEQIAQLKKMTSAQTIYLTCGEAGALLSHAGTISSQRALPVTIIDRVGSGDAFAAGALDGILDGDPHEGLRRGIALAAIALSQLGDRVLSSRAELEAVLMRQDGDISR